MRQAIRRLKAFYDHHFDFVLTCAVLLAVALSLAGLGFSAMSSAGLCG